MATVSATEMAQLNGWEIELLVKWRENAIESDLGFDVESINKMYPRWWSTRAEKKVKRRSMPDSFYEEKKKEEEKADEVEKAKGKEKDKERPEIVFETPYVPPKEVPTTSTSEVKVTSPPVKAGEAEEPEAVDQEGKGFRMRGKKYLITWATHINKNDLGSFLEGLGKMEKCYIAHERGNPEKLDPNKPENLNGYDHTHACVWYKAAFNDQSKNACHKFCFSTGETVYSKKTGKPTSCGKIHNNIAPIGASKTEWIRRCRYICKEDEECKAEVIAGGDYALNNMGALMEKKTLPQALRDVENPCHVSGIIQAYGFLRKPKLNPVRLEFEWQKTFKESMMNDPKIFNWRSIVWIYSKKGCLGKSKMALHLDVEDNEKEVQDVLILQQLGGTYHSATVVEGALSRGWSGEWILIDLERDAETHQIYGSLEAMKNGNMTTLKYNGRPVRWNGSKICVFANFPPNVLGKVSKDRWRIYELEKVKSKEGETEVYMTPRPWQKFIRRSPGYEAWVKAKLEKEAKAKRKASKSAESIEKKESEDATPQSLPPSSVAKSSGAGII
jgi:hypothetical protein